jgi:FMN phosphatase YigB (HAD superfamily)
MIGDDAEADVVGAMAAGLMGVLSKYRPDQETYLPHQPTLMPENLKAAVDLLLG